jgi:hypothetical protein
MALPRSPWVSQPCEMATLTNVTAEGNFDGHAPSQFPGDI